MKPKKFKVVCPKCGSDEIDIWQKLKTINGLDYSYIEIDCMYCGHEEIGEEFD
jgi:Zn finger protein HypA/HybF involved in hydrogenase expression